MALIANLKGTPGTPGSPGAPGTPGSNGTNGATWFTGTGAPNDSIGANNDLYLDVATSNVYKKVGGTWA